MHREPTFSAESYFETQPPPVSLQHDIERVREFVQRQQSEGRNVVLVTVSSIFQTSFLLQLPLISFFFGDPSRVVVRQYRLSSTCELISAFVSPRELNVIALLAFASSITSVLVRNYFLISCLSPLISYRFSI